MNLNSEQVEKVKTWISSGANVAQVQKMLDSELGISMTYMDVRFLIDDIGAQILEKPEKPAEVEPEISPETPPTDGFQSTEESPFSEESAASEGGESVGSVQVSVSPIQRPDALVSGDVVFSNGARAEWRIDRMGQLGLVPAPGGETPPQEDMYEFQKKLQELLSKM